MIKSIFDFKYIIFDINGTIINNRRLYRKLLLVLTKLGFCKKDNNLFLPTGGIPLPYWAVKLSHSQILTELVLSVDKGFLRFFKAIGTRNPKTFPNIKEVIKHLYNENVIIFASTGGNTKVETNCLQKLGILKYFSLVVGSDIAPKREHVHYFAKSVDMSVEDFASKTCSVGDGPVELMLALRYGIYSIGITNTMDRNTLIKAGAKEVISDFRELLQRMP
ncbi:MAG: HAD hydrolase-like protein [Patescibacteria group bacterium]|nr:HAD hydrolase-like protein [Patescibacteria group bacterium]MBU1877129.1 HAD hydrolase-like protein [Patescibacteria group bacterium]